MEALWQDLKKAGAYVYRLIETNEAYILVTDSSQAEKILKKDVRESLRGKKLGGSNASKVHFSKDCEVRGLEWCVSERSEQEIQT